MLNVYFQGPDGAEQGFRREHGKHYNLGSERSGEHLRYITQPLFQDDLGVVRPEFQASRVDGELQVLIDASANSRAVFNESALRLEDCNVQMGAPSGPLVRLVSPKVELYKDVEDSFSWHLVKN